MGRRKGGHNTRGIKQGYGEGLRIHLAKIFEKDLIRWVESLSLKTGITIKQVANHALTEGLSTLENDVYKELIKMLERKGKLIRERELETLSGGSEGPTSQERGTEPQTLFESLPAPEPAPDTDTSRPPHVVEQRGFGSEDQPSALVSDPEVEPMMEAISDGDPPL